MNAINVENDSFTCRQEKQFAILSLKKRMQEILTSLPEQYDLLQHLSIIQDDPEIKGLAVINLAEYPGDEEYKRLLADILPKTVYGDGYHGAFKYKSAINNILETILNFSIPIVGGLQGNIAPETLGIFLAFDSRISTDDTFFHQPNIKLGFPPSAILSFFLARNLGPARAIEHLLTKSEFSAEEAYNLGLLTQIVNRDNVEQICLEKLEKLAVMPPHIVTETRRLLQPNINKFHKHFDAYFESTRRILSQK